MPHKKKPGVYTAKNGAKYRILPNGKARFIKRNASAPSATKKKSKGKRTRSGGAARTGGSAMSGGGMTSHYLHY